MQRLSRSLISTAIRTPAVSGLRLGGNASLPTFSVRAFSTTGPAVPETQPRKTLDEIVKSIDTTLTPEQQEYVNSLKKKMRGGSRSRRSVYSSVPNPEEIEGLGNFIPKMAPNAEALIDYALSHIPKRDGARLSRHKKRMAQRIEIRQANEARRKEETRVVREVKQQKQAKVREEIKKVREEAKLINETNRLRAQVQEQRQKLKAQQDRQ